MPSHPVPKSKSKPQRKRVKSIINNSNITNLVTNGEKVVAI